MEVVVPNPEKKSTRTQAYTLAEVMVSVFILSVMMISLYAGFYSGFAIRQAFQEKIPLGRELELTTGLHRISI